MLDTLANVKLRLGITSNTNDAFLEEQIRLISDVIEAYCGRRFLTSGYKQTFHPESSITSKNIELYHFPVSAIASIKQDGVTLSPTSYRLHGPTGIVMSKQYCFNPCEEIEVTYTAGYVKCPSPILAVLDSLVSERYNKKMSGVDLNFGTDVQRISIPGAISLDFDYTLTSNERKSAFGTILGNYANVLDTYRSNRVVVNSDRLDYVEETP